MTAPSEQLARFIAEHPGQWDQWSREGGRYPVTYAVLRLHNLPNACITIGHEGAVVQTREGGEAGNTLPMLVKAPRDADLLTKIAYRVTDSLQWHGGRVDWLPAWLQGPVRQQLRARGAALIAMADEVSP